MRFRKMLGGVVGLFAVLLVAGMAHAELGYEVVWEVEGEGGFSAANLFSDALTGKPSGLVACEVEAGVVGFDLAGQRLWDYPMTPPVSAAPAVADVDGDGRDDVVAADGAGTLVALTGAGELIWTAQLRAGVESDACPAVADLDGDGDMEIVVGDNSGMVSCIDHRGAVVWRFVGEDLRMGPPLVADIYDAPGREIIITSLDHHIYALSARGEWLWDLYVPDDLFPNSTPILADADGDDMPELYLGGGLHHFYRIRLDEHRIERVLNTYLHINSAIAAADLDGDGKDEIVFGNKMGALWCYGGETGDEVEWTQEFREAGFHAAPGFADVDGDGDLEVFVFPRGGEIRVLDGDGSLLLGRKDSCRTAYAPLLGDFDEDGVLEAIIAQSAQSPRAMLCIKWGVPYAPHPGVPNGFAGNRSNSGGPADAEAYLLIPTPQTKAVAGRAKVAMEGESQLFSGPNTWRFGIENPDQKRLAFVAEIREPGGAAQRVVRHIRSSAGRAVIGFDIAERGSYGIVTRLLDADSLEVQFEQVQDLKFAGFEGDRRYLEEVVFAQIDQGLAEWAAANPEAAGCCAMELTALRGTLAGMAEAEKEPEQVQRLAGLRESAARLRSLVAAGTGLAPTGSFAAWECTPWAYFDGCASLPSPEDRTEELAASLCMGEYETLALNLTSFAGGPLEVRVICDGFEGREDLSAADHIEFRRAVTVPTTRRKEISDALPLLDQAGLISIAPLCSEQLWITVNADGLAPGAYTVQLRLKSIEPYPTERRIPITLTVHDLALPRPRPLRLCMWSYDGYDMGTEKPAVLKALIEHGTTIFFAKSPPAKADAEGNLLGAPDYAVFDEAVNRLSPHGMMLFKTPQSYFKGPDFLSEAWRKGFVAYLREWVKHLQEMGLDYDEWALYPYDEPSTPYTDTTLNLVDVAKVIREADPKILIYTDPMSGATKETAEMLKDLIDIWTPQLELLERVGDEFIPIIRPNATEIWSYDVLSRAKTLSCLGSYRWKFWFTWEMDFTGVGWWCFANNSGEDRWDGPNKAGTFYSTAYDGPGGVVTSKRWEAARDGVEDYEYLYLLRESIREALARGVSAAALEEAEELLSTLPGQVKEVLGTLDDRIPLTPDGVPEYEKTAEYMQEVRRRIVEACLEVRGLNP